MLYYSAIKKDKLEAFSGKEMQLENTMLSEIGQIHKLKYQREGGKDTENEQINTKQGEVQIIP